MSLGAFYISHRFIYTNDRMIFNLWNFRELFHMICLHSIARNFIEFVCSNHSVVYHSSKKCFAHNLFFFLSSLNNFTQFFSRFSVILHISRLNSTFYSIPTCIFEFDVESLKIQTSNDYVCRRSVVKLMELILNSYDF